MNVAQLAHAGADGLHRARAPVGEIDREQAVRGTRRFEDSADLRFGPAQRLLAEHRHPAAQRLDGLLGVQRARGRDDDSLQALLEQRGEARDEARAGNGFERRARDVGRGVGDRDHLRGAAAGDRFHPVAPDPADAEEAEPRTAHVRTNALRNPSGRVRTASNASPRRASGNSCV